jgi:hypothetical protein
MEKNLKFIDTLSIDDFKKKFDVKEIVIKKNESTGKCFFVFGVETGAVSRKVLTGQLTVPMISQVVSADTGDMFYLLHQKGEGKGATTLAVI